MRNQTFVAAALVLVTGMMMLPACSTANSDSSAPSCMNGTKDDTEEGVDCGGTCPTKCTGASCTAGTE